MLSAAELTNAIAVGRTVTRAVTGDPALGPFGELPGVWQNAGALVGHGWNMIALPYKKPGHIVQPDAPDQKSTFRLLVNQFNETLTFNVLDKAVPNRGAALHQVFDEDQHIAALQYVQHIQQLKAADFPVTPDAPDTPKGPSGPTQAIHHEPGLFLHLLSHGPHGIDIARMGTIPHGDSVLAMGHAFTHPGGPDFAPLGDFAPLPIGVTPDVTNNPYLLPYRTFHQSPFKGNIAAAGFPGFDPTNPLALLQAAVAGVNIKNTTTLIFDTSIATGGIHNIPFVTSQADATLMRAIFWIEELVTPPGAAPQFQLQYAQRVLLDFFPSPKGDGKKIRWPHITINTMKLVGPAP
jgi:hypothetical protein